MRMPDSLSMHEIVTAALVRQAQVLLVHRAPNRHAYPNVWDLPGGHREPGETELDALAREVREELGVESQAHDTLAVHEFDYAHGVHVELTFVRCTLASHAFTPAHAVHASRWVLPSDVKLSEVLEGDRDFLRSLGATD